MNTSQIKKFACEARNILKRGIAAKITTLGFDVKGNVPANLMPQLMQGGSLWKGELHTEGFCQQWMALYHRVEQKGIQEVCEEAAYTWFNRLMAIRILQKNRLCEPILAYTDAARTPRIVDEARMGRLPQMSEDTRTYLMKLLDDDTKVTEQFAVLIAAWCHANPIMQACFGNMADFTELLLPNNILAEGGFVDMINHTEFITDEDFYSPELIGWLYQFYISERKDEVFAKKKKFEADEIPAATQIFTPNWIVKYMVQNTVGRIFLDNTSGTNTFKDKWQYLVNQEQPSVENVYHYDELTDLKVADLACGSGHILNECFDILYDLYVYEGHSRSEAVENIFEHNLTGIDLDNRAKQLAMFSLMIKACQKDSSFADAHVLPNVLTMPKPYDEETNGPVEKFIHQFFNGSETKQMTTELKDAFWLMKDADSLGSIMKFDISDSTRYALVQTVDYWKKQEFIPQVIMDNMPVMELILSMTEKYSALVMNPPYMGGGNMNSILSKYVKENYEEGKADLFSVFMLLAIDKLKNNGKYGMINMQSWMFLSSFEKIRKRILNESQIDNMLHLGPRTFDELSGEVVQNTAFVISHQYPNHGGAYFRLVDGRSCADKERMFFKYKGLDDNKIYYPNVPQENFEKIPGCPIGYWVSKGIFRSFSNPKVSYISESKCGMNTGDNDSMIRLWHEISNSKFNSSCKSTEHFHSTNCLYAPYNKGGKSRKWYGNLDYVLKYDASSYKTLLNQGNHLPSRKYYFKECITWSDISSSSFGVTFRFEPKGTIFDGSAAVAFINGGSTLSYLLGLLNTPYTKLLADLLNPTLHFKLGDYNKIPFIESTQHTTIIENIVQENISISRLDWDAHETSWDFQTNAIVQNANNNQKESNRTQHSIKDIYTQFTIEWEERFMQLHANEEELNRQFIDIYGLQDELTPAVLLREVTILQQGEISIIEASGDETGTRATIQWNANVIMKQLISYAVGVWMGRYRLDKTGLHIAHPEPTTEELVPYEYNKEPVYIDDDGIIPLLPSSCPFDDNLVKRIADFVRIAFGVDMLTENLNFIEKCLGTTIEQYLLKDYWKNHKKMYQNRPIYWLFSSKKGAFKCITYMHRMTPYTAEQIRSKYLLPYIEYLRNRINELDSRAASLTTAERKQLDGLNSTIEECKEYHDHLQVVAEDTTRTAFDLDDGVVVNYAKYGDVLAKIK